MMYDVKNTINRLKIAISETFGVCCFNEAILNSSSPPRSVSQLSKEVAGLNMNFPLQVKTETHFVIAF